MAGARGCVGFLCFIFVSGLYNNSSILLNGLHLLQMQRQNTFVFGSCWFVYFSVWSIKFGKNSLFSLSFGVLEKGFEIFSIEIYKINFDFLFQYYSFPLLFLFLLIAGFCYLYKRNRFCFVQIFSVFALTLLAAYLKLYPFERRLALFLLPFLIIVSIYPLDNLKKNGNLLFVY